MLKPRTKIRFPRKNMASGGAASEEFDIVWDKLSSALKEIHTKNASNLSFEELYRSAYKLVLKKQGERLYDSVCNLEADWFKNVVLKDIRDTISSTLLVRGDESLSTADAANERWQAGERLLAKVRQIWDEQVTCLGMINDVLMYMDRALTSEKKRRPIYVSGMNVFRDNILRQGSRPDDDKTIISTVLDTILTLIWLERNGNTVDRYAIHHCVTMFQNLYDSDDEELANKLYLTQFEPKFLQQSEQFYSAEGLSLIQSTDAISYCRHVQRRIDEERDRCDIALFPATEPKVQSVIDASLITPHIGTAIAMEGSGVKHMLDNDITDDLNVLFKLVSRIDNQKIELRNAFKKRVMELGEQINSNATEAGKAPPAAPAPKEGADKEKGKIKGSHDKTVVVNAQTAAAIKWVDDVLDLKAKYDDIWKRAFDEDHGLQAALTEGLTEFINSNVRSSEYLSLFFDENLKKGIKGKTEEEVDALLDRGITLLRYITDKDLFEQYYKKHLSRRLLTKRSVSMDAERHIISKMKMEVGTQFTSKLENMFKDMATSADVTSAYQDHVAKTNTSGERLVELEMNVLTSTVWPMEMMAKRDNQEAVPIKFPAHIERLKQSFEQFYYGKHSGRKLSWQPSMGSADIRAVFPRPSGKLARHELNVSTYAMIILLLFNDIPAGQSISFEDIQRRTGIPLNELTRNLQSLAVAPKTRVLRKEPMTRDIKEGDQFFFNEKFQSPYTRVKIGVVSNAGNKVENKEQRKETEQKMSGERGITIEAAIVRIMK
ncbi:Cullin-3 [Ascosphaera atra]|nr:Cullin-3 [Ascosphaera atra]